MKKRIILILLTTILTFMLCGCTYYENYMWMYKKELGIVFGEYDTKSLGQKYYGGYDGIGSYNYYSWEICYLNTYGEKTTATIQNGNNFDNQIKQIFEEELEYVLEKELTHNYIPLDDYDYLYCDFVFYHDERDYFKNGNSIFETYENRINDYEFFNVTNINIDKLISDELVAVHKIIFRVVDDAPLDEQLQQDLVIPLTDIVKELAIYIPVNEAYFEVNDEWILLYENDIY